MLFILHSFFLSVRFTDSFPLSFPFCYWAKSVVFISDTTFFSFEIFIWSFCMVYIFHQGIFVFPLVSISNAVCLFYIAVLRSLISPASVSFHIWHFLIVFSFGNCSYFTGFGVSSNFGLHHGHFEYCVVRLTPLTSSREYWLFFCLIRHRPGWVQIELSFWTSLDGGFSISSVL